MEGNNNRVQQQKRKLSREKEGRGQEGEMGAWEGEEVTGGKVRRRDGT